MPLSRFVICMSECISPHISSPYSFQNTPFLLPWTSNTSNEPTAKKKILQPTHSSWLSFFLKRVHCNERPNHHVSLIVMTMNLFLPKTTKYLSSLYPTAHNKLPDTSISHQSLTRSPLYQITTNWTHFETHTPPLDYSQPHILIS